MKKFYNIIPLLICFFLINECGYKPIFLKEKLNFFINKIEFSGDRKINRLIDQNLYSYKKINNKKETNLQINSEKKTSVSSRNSSGDPNSYILNIKIDIKAFINSNKILQKSYSKQTSYNKFERKSDQINYEKKLSKDLTKEIIDQIILNLATKIK
jgi:hypothetical protein